MHPIRFALRDDDTSAFTTPESLESAYGHLWDRHPVSLAVIPFAVETRHLGDPARFEQGDEAVPLGHNRRLVRFLRDAIAAGHVSILLHGHRHRYRRGTRAGEWIPEFVAADDPHRLIGEGRRYLESLLDVRIRTFVPPSNAMSPAAYAAVRRHGLNLTQLPALRVALASASPSAWPTLARRIGARLAGSDMPDVLQLATHRELAAIPITPRTPFESVRDALDRRRRTVCLATHHWELDRAVDPSVAHPGGPGVTVGDVLAGALAWLDARGAIGVTVDDLFEPDYAAA